ncbi:MAG: CocE/NonD family hydrolase [Thermoplasmata archaeon]
MEKRIKRYVKIRLRDGINVVGDIYFPDSPPPYSTIVFRTPYGRQDQRYRDNAYFFSSNGYVFLNFDVRGRGDSDGEFVPYFNEGKDGYDIIEWVASQQWSNGMVGTYGASYSARIQWLTAVERPPHLKAMVSIVSPSDPFVESPTGVQDPMHLSWRYLVSGRTYKDPSDVNWDDVYRTIPLKDMPEKLGYDIPDWSEDMKHQTLDDYWKRICYQNKFNIIDVPVMHISGWYDDEQIGTFINYIGMRNHSLSNYSRENQAIVVGPWPHGVNKSQKLGDIDFGPQAIINLPDLELKWFRKHLDGQDITIKRSRLFIMGINQWKEFDDWPVPGTENIKFFITSGGRANSRFGDGKLILSSSGITDGEDSYIYDPENPVPFITEITSAQIGGPDNYSSVERRDDVLVYTSEILEDDLTLLGDVRAVLYIKSDAPDTDFMAMLTDVWPNGYSQRLCDGMVRTRYRRGMDKIVFLEEGVNEIEINMWNTGHTFKKGHRIRVDISSSAFPKYSRNPNTGSMDIASETNMREARNTVIHQMKFPSRIETRVLR